MTVLVLLLLILVNPSIAGGADLTDDLSGNEVLMTSLVTGEQSSTMKCPPQCVCSSAVVNCMFLNLTDLTLINSIPKEVEILDLRFNKIKHIPRGSFRHLRNLNTLLLNNNKITKLKNGAFAGLHQLKYLYLYKNEIHFIEEKVFSHMPNLEHLYLHFNYLKKLSPNLFTGLPQLNRLFLHNNKLSNLPNGAFEDLASLKRLRIDGNPLNCDCDVAWLATFAQENRGSVQIAANCESPNALSGRLVDTLTSDDLKCEFLHFLREPTDADVTPGGSILFYCRASGGTQVPSIQWRKNGEIIDLQTQTRYRQLSDGSLMITDASTDDVGVYECVATADGQEISSRPARMRYYRPRAKPTIVHSPIPTEVRKGETIVLSCGALGFPEPTFEWYRDGGRLSSAHSRYKVEKNGTLIITNAQLDDSAHYRCSASNYLGKASSSARVKVNLALPDSKPAFTSLPRNATARETSIVEFTCVAVGHPYPDITWWNNNRLVLSDGRITVSNGGQHLRIQDVKMYDRGTYHCRAENRLGRSEVSAVLTVEEQPLPVVITTPPHDATAPRGATVQMPCKAEGLPLPKISWKKDGSVVTTDRRHRLSADGSLIVYDVTEDDAGMYECAADNGRERRTSEARFTVRDLPPPLAPQSKPTTRSPSAPPSPSTTQSPSVSYDIGDPTPGDGFVLVSLEEASNSIDRALNATISQLFSGSEKNSAETHEALNQLRFPPESEREVAKAAEIYERTLELVAQRVRNLGDAISETLPKNFTYVDLVSPTYLELLANLSGCEAHRSRRDANCTDMCFHSKFRTIDGTCNNLKNPLWGASLTAFKRNLPPQYENGFNHPIGWNPDKLYNGFRKPSARKISTSLISSAKVTKDDELTHMVMQWGQFLDHDLDHAMESISRETFENGITCGATCENRPPCFPIKIDQGDPRIRGRECMEFTRSSATCGSGSTSVFFGKVQPREQLNRLTSYIDASQVYGSRDDLAISLRNLTNDFGRLREGPSNDYGNPLLPFNDRHDIDCRRDPRESGLGCFLTGDVRANEQLGLLSMHTIWFREHNRIVTELRQLNPSWSSDRLYEEGRKIIGAEMQHITYQHWLPMVLGKEGMDQIGEYKGYNPSVDASVANVFAASAFRFGHTLIHPLLERLDGNFEQIPEGHLPLRKAFFAPWRIVQEGGVDPILRGFFATAAKMNLPNEVLNSELTENLFEAAHSVALDLAALNIQRGRDHGLPSYVEWRHWCGLDKQKIEQWGELSVAIKADDVRRKLEELYGHPGNIDMWVGGVLEDLVDGGKVGPTFRCILVDQFKRVRDGDRFWYENPSTFKSEQLSQLKQTSLTRVVCDNSDDIKKVPKDIFKMNKGGSDSFVDCRSLPQISLHVWFECEKDSKFEEHRPQISRVRRMTSEYSLLEDEDDWVFGDTKPMFQTVAHKPNWGYGDTKPMSQTVADKPNWGYDEDKNEARIEGLEDVIQQSRLEVKRMRQKLKRLTRRIESRTGVKSRKNRVCIDFHGELRHESESWLHQSDTGSCAQCQCQKFEVVCHLTTCPE